ncbi:hypothetical protein VMCG_01459 [Cytospora schulzeri]|uniref:SHSP domain-containing protein n=1 Tax=Cytospora schulzeri TaxID=448051 RepID=A0A423X6D7_9PEZI|nr:hypothetical protein VMCG_01459 [Valsa malicola]
MAWPGNFNWNNYGSGVDRAPPPPPAYGMGPFANPEFWQRCFEERRGWDDWNPEHQRGPHDHPHGHGRGFGRRGGRRHGGRRGHGADGGEGHHSATDNEEFPPEYIDDEEVAEAVADGEKGHENEKEQEKERDGADSPDTLTRELTPTSDDPPEGVPSEEEGPRQRGGPGCHGRHGSFGRRGRGGHGPHGRGDHRRHGPGPRGFPHHGPPPPPPFFSAMFGGGPRGPHGEHGGPPMPPFLEALFGGGPGPRGGPGGPGGPHGRHHHGPPPPPPFEGLFGAGPGPHGGPGGPGSHGPHGPPPPPPEGPAGAGSSFDFRPWMSMLANHPLARNMREYIERAQNGNREGPGDKSGDDKDVDSFTPPLDLFEQKDKWVLHLAVPGAKKEDVGVSWDADRSVLSVSGVVHRPGDEEFLRGLISGERSTGLFSREVRLPPAEGGGQKQESSSKEEVDAEGIEARMEDGILIVTVPKVEKGWTEVRKVDIQ